MGVSHVMCVHTHACVCVYVPVCMHVCVYAHVGVMEEERGISAAGKQIVDVKFWQLLLFHKRQHLACCSHHLSEWHWRSGVREEESTTASR